jgi:hypothetical protein
MELRETETQLVRGDMKVRDCHERWVTAAPDRITALIADFDLVSRAFRVASPEEIRGEHWFELVPDGSGTVVRHTIEATAAGRYEAVWAERIGPKHGVIMEALLDNVQALVR